MNTNSRCWSCHHFLANDRESAVDGRCTRYAPNARGFMFMNETLSRFMNLSAAFIDAAVQTGPDSLPLAICSATGALPTAPVNLADGLNDNGVHPFAIPQGDPALSGVFVRRVSIGASLFNTGAASVGATVVARIEILRVNGGNSEIIGSVDVPLDPAHVGVAGNVTDDYQYASVTIPDTTYITANSTIGIRINLSTALNTVVSEVRNPVVGVVLESVGTFNPPTIQQFTYIQKGDVSWCGDYHPMTGTVPPVPVIP